MTNRITNNFAYIDQGDSKLQQELQLYKAPATIRDLKTVFLYIQINADTTTLNPITLFDNKSLIWNPIEGEQPPRVAPYYLPIGTKRPFQVGEAVNSLLDLRIPKDKYVVEINMVEAQIESNPTNWTLIPESRPNFGEDKTVTSISPIFKPNYQYVLGTTGSPSGVNPTTETSTLDPPDRILGIVSYDQAQKKTIPQSLFCRLRGSNQTEEPYSWVVTNNGSVALDKSHLLRVQHGDMGFNNLELEFGHLLFRGSDINYTNFLTNDVLPNSSSVLNGIGPILAEYDSTNQNKALQVLGDKARYRDFTYLDYNWEWDNNRVITSRKDGEIYPAQRNGFTETRMPSQAQWDVSGGPASSDYQNVLLQSDPLKSNQQVANLYFRFSIKLIHLF